MITCEKHAAEKVFYGDCPDCCKALDNWRPTTPSLGMITGYATEDEARAMWSKIKDNWDYVIYEIRIGAFGPKPAELPVAWVILKDLQS